VSEFKQKVLTAAVDRYVLTPTQCMMLAPRRASDRHETRAGAGQGWRDTYSITYANLLILLGSIRPALQVDLLKVINELNYGR
jgi:hypothetical protein